MRENSFARANFVMRSILYIIKQLDTGNFFYFFFLSFSCFSFCNEKFNAILLLYYYSLRAISLCNVRKKLSDKKRIKYFGIFAFVFTVWMCESNFHNVMLKEKFHVSIDLARVFLSQKSFQRCCA